MRKTTVALVIVVLLVLVASPLSAAVIYVKGDAAGTNTGTSWINAYLLLQSALDAAVSGDEIWVAAGTYKPTSDYGLGIGNRGMHFRMKNGVGIYGGFAGTETARSERNWTTNVTTLSGDIGVGGDTSDNSYHLFYHWDIGLDATAVLDGFTVTGGKANGSYPHSWAGGMLNYQSSPTIANCTFSGNSADGYGGGMNNDLSSPIIRYCTFSGNSGAPGGGMLNQNSSYPTIANCTFSGNTATYGGGMYNSASAPVVTTCTFTGNSGGSGGGGVCNQGDDSTPVFVGCTFTDNSASSGGGIYNYDSAAPTISTCTFTDNTATSCGGGIYNGSSAPTISACVFSGNSCVGVPAGQFGGGMFNDTSAAVVSNCVFKGNSANYGGGMLNVSAPSPTVTNCTFNGNLAVWGGGIFNWTSSVATVRNCILWGDSATNGPEVYNNNGTATFRYCDIAGCGGSGAGWSTAIGTDGGGNIAADSLFMDADAGDYHLAAESPCIDAADGSVAPNTDREGTSRYDFLLVPNTGTGTPNYADIGAYEFVPPPVLVTYPSDSGISLERGKACNVEWTTTLPPGTRFKIKLVKGSGGTWFLSTTASKSPFKWTVGKAIKGVDMYLDGDDYRIQVSPLSGSASDESDNDFSIGTVDSLTVTGSTSVTGGSTAQYTCTAHYTFGADRVVTNEVKWSCTKVKGVKIGKTGLLTTAPVIVDQPCIITAAYGKGKPPITGNLGITITQ